MEAARLQIGDVFGETSTKEKARRAVNTVTLTDCEFF
jgi:CRP-like cAMP-binding protein